MFNLFQKKPAAKQPPVAHKQPDFPFDLTGYTCFSIINCPVEQAAQLVEEYAGIAKPVRETQEFSFQIAALPEAPQWTVVRWPNQAGFSI